MTNIWGLKKKLKRAGQMVRNLEANHKRIEAEHIRGGMQNIREKIRKLREEKKKHGGKK